MDLELKGRVALVTGSGQGIGRQIAKTLAQEGALVAVNDYFSERAEAVAAEIEHASGSALPCQADIVNQQAVLDMVAVVRSELGPVDILVNNAGVPIEVREGRTPRTLFIDSDSIAWKQQIDLNYYGCLNCVHAVLSEMIERRSGKILSLISEAGRMGEYNLAVYSGAKAGILGFSKALAREVGKHAINVNCVAIGATAHEAMPTLNPDDTPESNPRLAKMLKSYPMGRGLGRVGRPTDVANAVAFLVSDRAMFITGQCLSVSGGFSMVS